MPFSCAKKYFFIFLTTSILFIYACEEVVVINEIENTNATWKKDPRFNLHQSILTNSHFTGDQLFVTNPFSFIKIEQFDHTSPVENWDYNAYVRRTYIDPLIKWAIHDDYYISIGFNSQDNSSVIIYPTDNPVWSDGDAGLNMKEEDSLFLHFDFSMSLISQSFGLMDRYALLAYRQQNSPTPAILLLRINISDFNGALSFDQVQIVDKKIIIIDSIASAYPQEVREIHVADNYFFLNTGGALFRIDTLGNCNLLSVEGIRRTFQDKLINRIYSITRNGTLFFTDDFGVSWNEFSTPLPIWSFDQLRYQNVGDRIYGVLNDQITEFIFTGTTVEFNELPSDGLEGKLITSINQLSDSLLYATTLSGGYYTTLSKLYN